ncbi:hypothetical protein NC651_016221 [Populus alba x Populus x berolinensis]|nr:hypothetical protein NC651_016221 [Populus alba x Populus x berolinensis]
MTGDDRAPLLLLAPGAEKKTQLLLGQWGRDMARETTETNCWCRDETGRTTGLLLRLVPASSESAMAAGAEDDAAVEAGDGCVLVQNSENCLFVMLLDRGGESSGDGEKPKRKKERMRLWFSSCSGDRGKIFFSFENGDGKGSVWLKVVAERESENLC